MQQHVDPHRDVAEREEEDEREAIAIAIARLNEMRRHSLEVRQAWLKATDRCF